MHLRHFGSVSRWLAVIAMLLPLLLPTVPSEAGTVVARASVSGDIFASELCSITHATRHDDGSQLPIDYRHQHCPLCTMIQQLSACMAATLPALSAGIFGNEALPKKISAVHSLEFHSPEQPRAPPVRV
jgi:DUF2946 family protein